MTYQQITSLTAEIVEHLSASGCGYCEVPSTSRKNKTHRVYVSNRLYSVRCTCEAGSHNQDCGHRVAVDLHLAERREQRAKDAERTAYLNYELSIGA
jgi:hypothetical protein